MANIFEFNYFVFVDVVLLAFRRSLFSAFSSRSNWGILGRFALT